jgi:hypothetical protein
MRNLRSWAFLAVGIVTATAAAACGGDPGSPDIGAPGGYSGDPGNPGNPGASSGGNATPPGPSPQGTGVPSPTCTGEAISEMVQGAPQLAKLCARGYGDPITHAFCGGATPSLTSVSDVLKLFGFVFKPGPYVQGQTSGFNGNPSFMFTAQSTSLSTRRVSQINPRAILFTPPLARGRMTGAPQPNPSYVAIGYTRGEQAFELVAKDPTANGGKGDLRFFLLKYEQACNTQAGGCTNGDLYTPAAESGFTDWSLYDDEDLKDTTLDCRQCHQPGGPGTPKILRMQELERPWQHWMYNDSTGITALRADFHAAHGTTEPYAGIPAGALDHGDVQQLEGFVENNGFQAQPNEFQGVKILAELTATPGSSATWQGLYQGSEGGQFIPVPYYDFRATDPTKVQALATQYAAVAAGTVPASQLGNMSDVFSDAAERAMTHKPAAGLTGRQILVQICQQCHNARLDQTISRASFDVEKLDTLSRAEKDEAIRRITLPVNDCSHMPPTRFRDLDASEIALVQAELAK